MRMDKSQLKLLISCKFACYKGVECVTCFYVQYESEEEKQSRAFVAVSPCPTSEVHP